MADRYWVGGGSSTNWNATANTNWSATSGGANNASVPTTTDVAIFDANSGTGTSVISASITIQKLVTTNYAGTITHNTSVTLTLNTGAADSLIFGSGMTYTPATTTSLITFTHTSGTADITSNGKRMAALTINGAGGTTRLLDALRVDTISNSVLTLTSGTFNANNFNVTAHIVAASGSTTRVLTMGSGTWTIGGSVSAGTSIWNAATTTNLTLNRNTAAIVVASVGSSILRVFASGSLQYNGITFNANSAGGGIQITGTPTWNGNFVAAEGNAFYLPGGTMSVVGNLTITGISSRPNMIVPSAAGSAPVVSVTGAAALAWCGLHSIASAGGGTFTATNSFDFGGNTGWTIAAPASSDLSTIISDLAAVKAKTDNLPSDPADASVVAGRFDTLDTTLAGTLLADIRKVNNIAIDGAGTEGNPFGPA